MWLAQPTADGAICAPRDEWFAARLQFERPSKARNAIVSLNKSGVLMKVIGIDPAPAKGLDVFDGKYRHINVNKAHAFIDKITALQDVLVCWDAPLTGPCRHTVDGGSASGSDFSQRLIESFFNTSATGFKAPNGISVRGYSGCPHWALTRSLLGLPRLGQYDRGYSKLPFGLVTTGSRPRTGRHVAEVHPGLAIWLWCRSKRAVAASWVYKKSDAVLRELWDCVIDIPEVSSILTTARCRPKTNDELDARIAYTLGKLWLKSPQSVVILGSADHGTFLLPRIDTLEDEFSRFVRAHATQGIRTSSSGRKQ